MRERIGALALVAVAVACAACGGGTTATAAPPGGSGGGAATAAPVACVNLSSLGKTVGQLTALKAGTDSTTSIRLAANNVIAQAATFVSAAPGELRATAQGLRDAVEGVRKAVGQSQGGSDAVAAALAAVDAAWKELEAKMAAVCPK
jgi:hypothetical protein